MSDDLAKMKAIAEAATPGPWMTHLVDDMSIVAGTRDEIASTAPPGYGTDDDVDFSTDTDRCEANAAFIAAANPSAVLSLIKRVEEAEAEVQDLTEAVELGTKDLASAWNGNALVVAENARLRTLLAEAGEALAGVVRVADRATTEFDAARTVATKIEEIGHE